MLSNVEKVAWPIAFGIFHYRNLGMYVFMYGTAFVTVADHTHSTSLRGAYHLRHQVAEVNGLRLPFLEWCLQKEWIAI